MLNKGFKAAGTVNPSRFVKVASAGLDSQVLQAGAGDSYLLGVSQEWTQDAPIPSETTGDAAASGEQVAVYGIGDVCLLQAGAGGFAMQNYLKSDADGKGIAATLGTDFIGAIALETVAANGLGRVQVQMIR